MDPAAHVADQQPGPSRAICRPRAPRMWGRRSRRRSSKSRAAPSGSVRSRTYAASMRARSSTRPESRSLRARDRFEEARGARIRSSGGVLRDPELAQELVTRLVARGSRAIARSSRLTVADMSPRLSARNAGRAEPAPGVLGEAAPCADRTRRARSAADTPARGGSRRTRRGPARSADSASSRSAKRSCSSARSRFGAAR